MHKIFKDIEPTKPFKYFFLILLIIYWFAVIQYIIYYKVICGHWRMTDIFPFITLLAIFFFLLIFVLCLFNIPKAQDGNMVYYLMRDFTVFFYSPNYYDKEMKLFVFGFKNLLLRFKIAGLIAFPLMFNFISDNMYRLTL